MTRSNGNGRTSSPAATNGDHLLTYRDLAINPAMVPPGDLDYGLGDASAQATRVVLNDLPPAEVFESDEDLKAIADALSSLDD